MERKRVLITGATSGIGWATALLFSKNNFDLIVCGRRKDRLEQLVKEIQNVEVLPLSFDIRNRKEIHEAFSKLQNKNIDFLINNAGNAHGLSSIEDGDMEDWDQMIDINLKGLLYITKEILPFLLESRSGHIINIGSIAGLEVYPKGNVYCASKHAVVALSEAMRMDLLGKGIKVSCINPGLVETEFSEVRFKGNKEQAKKVYDGLQPLTAQNIADVIFYIASQSSHVNISDVTILPASQASATLTHRVFI